MALLRRGGEHYAGQYVAAPPGTHAAAVAALARHCPKDAPVLDFGCYFGAMIKRLHNAGFSDVSGTDLAARFTEDPGFAFVEADLNADFVERFPRRDYGALMVSEVIEHLDDPRHFLRGARQLLAPDGLVILTTPNVAFFEGRIKFMLRGELWGFGANNYLGQRHISPITREQVPIILRECGFELIEMFTAGSFATPLRRVVTAPLWAPMRLAFGSSTLGESLMIVGRRKEAADESASSTALWASR